MVLIPAPHSPGYRIASEALKGNLTGRVIEESRDFFD